MTPKNFLCGKQAEGLGLETNLKYIECNGQGKCIAHINKGKMFVNYW